MPGWEFWAVTALTDTNSTKTHTKWWYFLHFSGVVKNSQAFLVYTIQQCIKSIDYFLYKMLHYIQTRFWNFNLAQTKDKKELSSFPFMNMCVPTDMLIGLYNFSTRLISIKEIEQKNTVMDVT